MPILYEDEFIGRIEPVLRDGKLLMKGLWKEVNWNGEMEQKFMEVFTGFKQSLKVSEIVFNL